MQQQQPADVLYIGTDVRFSLQVPRYSCCKEGCAGMFAPRPSAVGCFPANPKASWDVARYSESYAARWLDYRLLQLADTLIFQGGRSIAGHAFASAVHKQHTLNGCSAPLGFDHFKRQLL